VHVQRGGQRRSLSIIARQVLPEKRLHQPRSRSVPAGGSRFSVSMNAVPSSPM
jgi:hypothetical protein